jgi:hypothetical protein
MKKVFLIFWLATVVLSAQAQNVPKDSVITNLRKIRNGLMSAPTASVAVNSSIKSCTVYINDVLLKLSDFKGNYPMAYVQSLHRLADLARSVKDLDSTEQLKVVSLLFGDLQLKFKEAPNQLGGALYNDLLKVTVETFGPSGQVGGLRVRYSFLGYKINYNRPDGSFQKLTSPGIEPMAPGWYEIWVTKDGDYTVLRNWSGEIGPDKENTIQLSIKQ